MSNPMKNFERDLRQSADRVRRTPSSQLRHRTISRLQEMPITAQAARGHSTRWSLAVYALLMMAALSYAYLQTDRQPQSEISARRSSKLSAPLNWSSLSQWSVSPVQTAMSKPLMDEWDLLARDAERTIDRVRQQIARLPRLDAISPGPDEAAPERTDLR